MHQFHRRSVPGEAARSGRALLPVLLVAQLMVILDISAVNVALPDLAKGLRIGNGEIGWTITSYSLLFGSLLLLGGRAADLLGRRRVFLAGLGVFTLASLGSSLAGTGAELFIARAGQGLGAALLSPAALSIITGVFGGEARARALGAWGAVSGGGAAIGVLLGGVLTDLVDWRAIFYINLPIGLVLAAAAYMVVPRDSHQPRWRGLDLRGALAASASVAALVYAISHASSGGWGSARTLGFGLAGLTGLAAFAALERTTTQPLLRVQRLADRAVGGGFVLMLAAAAVLFSMFLLTSLYLQNVRGTSPLETGLAFLPLAIAAAAGAHLGSQLVRWLGVRVPMAAAFAVAAAGTLLLSRVGAGGSYAVSVLPGMVLAAFALGVVLVSIAVSVLTGARAEETGMLSGLNTTGHELGGTLGVALAVTIAAAGAGAGAPIGVAGISNAFVFVSVLAAAASVLALLVLPSARVFLPRLRMAPASMPIH